MSTLSQTNPPSGISIRDVFVFVTIAAIATALFTTYNPYSTIAFLLAIYTCGWRLLNLNANPITRITLLLIAIALISPLLLWFSSPDMRRFNQRIGYQWGGSYLYPFVCLLPIPIITFAWKCFRPKLTVRRYVLESVLECFVLIPAYILFVVGI